MLIQCSKVSKLLYKLFSGLFDKLSNKEQFSNEQHLFEMAKLFVTFWMSLLLLLNNVMHPW